VEGMGNRECKKSILTTNRKLKINNKYLMRPALPVRRLAISVSVGEKTEKTAVRFHMDSLSMANKFDTLFHDCFFFLSYFIYSRHVWRLCTLFIKITMRSDRVKKPVTLDLSCLQSCHNELHNSASAHFTQPQKSSK
jgi:hypothetical protein